MTAHTFVTMGTVVSIRLAHTEPDDPRAVDAVADAHAAFTTLDERFSLYREDSELSRVARGELALADASESLREAYADALDWRSRTNGDFTPHRPDGVIDLNGTIKAVGIERAADALRAHGFADFSVNCGGDVLVAGSATSVLPGAGSASSGTWPTGIVNPSDRDSLLSAVNLTNEWCAIATSSVVERGSHIWSRPYTETPDGLASDAIYAQVTVIAHDIITADVWATAIMSGGRRALDFAVSNNELAVLAVTHAGELVGNARFRELVAH